MVLKALATGNGCWRGIVLGIGVVSVASPCIKLLGTAGVTVLIVGLWPDAFRNPSLLADVLSHAVAFHFFGGFFLSQILNSAKCS